jgi:hypothetical protein
METERKKVKDMAEGEEAARNPTNQKSTMARLQSQNLRVLLKTT